MTMKAVRKNVQERVTRSIPTRDAQTLDSARTRLAQMARDIVASTRDTILSPPTPEELAAWGSEEWRMDLGLVWEGGIKPILDALAPDDRAKVLRRLDGYARAQGTGSVANNGSPSFGTEMTDGSNSLRQERDATSAVLRKMNDDNRRAAAEHWPLG